jgi:cell division protein ZapA
MGQESIPVEIFGTEYTLKSDADIEHIQQIAKMVDEKMRRLAENSTVKSPAKLAVLTALNIADELHQFKDKYHSLIHNINVKSKEISERVDYYVNSVTNSNS